MKPKLIIIEGAQGCGKTKVGNELRERIECNTLISETGIKDKTIIGKTLSHAYHKNILELLKNSKDLDMNFTLVRSFVTEQVYTKLNYKSYDFDSSYNYFLDRLDYLGRDYDIYLIVLTCDKKHYKQRLDRNKVEYNKFSVENSLAQQEQYIKEIDYIYKNTKNITCITVENENFDNTVESIIRVTK